MGTKYFSMGRGTFAPPVTCSTNGSSLPLRWASILLHSCSMSALVSWSVVLYMRCAMIPRFSFAVKTPLQFMASQ